MKKLIIIAFSALLAVAAYAQTIPECWKIQWNVGCLYDPDGSYNGIMDNYSIIWDLCWSASADKSDEVILGSRIWDSGSTAYTDNDNASYYMNVPTFDNYMMATVGDTSVTIPVANTGTSSPGYFWQRIVALSDSASGTDYIWEGDAVQIESTTSRMSVGQCLDGDIAEIGDTTSWSVYSPAAVPEPATMSLLGLGALAMVLRRKLRK